MEPASRALLHQQRHTVLRSVGEIENSLVHTLSYLLMVFFIAIYMMKTTKILRKGRAEGG